MSYDTRHRQLALLLNRFRWEDAEQARREGRPYDGCRPVLLISDVQKVQSDGIDRRDTDLVLELLALQLAAGRGRSWPPAAGFRRRRHAGDFGGMPECGTARRDPALYRALAQVRRSIRATDRARHSASGMR